MQGRNYANIEQLFADIHKHNIGNLSKYKIRKFQTLLAQIQNINDVDVNDNGSTPLHVAVSKGHRGIVQLLLEKQNINVNIKNNQGNTPLHVAVLKGESEIVDSLLKEGAKINIKNNDHKTPLGIAEDLNIRVIMEKLKEHSELGPGPSNQQAAVQQLSLANIPKQGSNVQLQPIPTATNRVVLFREDEQNRKLGWYTEEQLKTNPNLLFLFGDNDKAKYRTDKGNPGGSGQAQITRPREKQPFDRLPDKGGINGNAVGITTTFYDGYTPNIDEFKVLIDGEFQPIKTWVRKGGFVVIPCNNQGKHSLDTGIAKLEDNIPGSIEYIQSKIDELVRLGKQTAEQSLPDFQELKRDLHRTLSSDGKSYKRFRGLKVYLSRRSPFQQQPQRKRTRAASGKSSQGDGSKRKSRLSSHQAAQHGRKRSHNDEESELESSPPESEQYSASGGLKRSLHGAIYQLKLLMLFLMKGLDEKYYFRLATEMDAADKFDDVVFQYERDKGDGTGRETVWRFLQAKHSQIKSKRITVVDLLTSAKKGDFKLDKYFVSYLRINKKQEFQVGYREDFIICTNIGLDLEGSVQDKVRKLKTPGNGNVEEKEISVEAVDANDPFLDLGNGARYKLKYSNDIVLYLKQSDQVKEEIQEQNIDIDKEIKEFLEKLVLAVDQPNEVELDNIMQDTISKEFSRRFNYFGNNESAYNSFLKGMLDWMKKKGGRFLSPEEGKAFFKEAERLASDLGEMKGDVKEIKAVQKENNKMLEYLCKDAIQPMKSNVENAACGLGITKHYYIPRTFTRPIVKNECFKADIADLFLISDMEENELSRLIHKEEKMRKFTDKDPDETKPIRFIILNDRKAEKYFKDLCEKHQKFNIHWFKKEDNQLIWQYSQGDLSKLRAFVDENKKKTKDINKITDIKEKVVIIAAGPGMGKSTLLTHLAEEQIRNPSNLLKVVRINLNDHVDNISNTNFDQEERVIDFLQGIEPELEEPRYSKFKRVAILFDGFDEISPDYKEKIIKLLQILKDTEVEKLWVTTRPHMRNELEDELSVFSYTLEPFSRENQEEFLEKFWKTNLIHAISFEKIRKLVNKIGKSFDSDEVDNWTEEISTIISIIDLEMEHSDLEKIGNLILKFNKNDLRNPEELVRETMNIIDKQPKISEEIKSIVKEIKDIDTLKESKNSIQERAKLYAAKLVEKFSNSVHDKEREFTKIPLQTRMLAEAFQGNFQTFYSSGQSNPDLPNNLDLLDLYEQFIRSKYEVYFRDKMKTDKMSNPAVIEFLDSNIKADSKDCGNLALRILFSNREVGSLSDIDIGGIQLIKLQRIGIIELVNNKPSFVHRTFAEYFTANLFADRLMGKKYSKKYKTVCCFLRKHIFKNNNEVIRNFLDRKLAATNEIHTATLNNDENAVSDLLSRDRDIVNSIDKQGRTALHLAVIYGYKKIVEILLEHNAAFDIADDTFGWRPLSFADKVSERSSERSIVELLLQKGANGADMFEAIQGINVAVIVGERLLHMAAQGGFLEFAKVLVQNGADVNNKNSDGKTPLHKAAELDRLSVVEYLVENDADLNAKDYRGCTPLHLVAKFGSIEVVKYLVDKGANFKLQDCSNYTPLHKAAESGKLEVVNYFVDKWAELNTPAFNGCTPIHKATQTGNLEVVKCLIENGANVNVADKKGIIPIHIAASIGHLSIMQYFVEQKSIDIECTDNDGQTSLHKAAYHGKQSVVEYLVDKGANLGAKDKYGSTVLHLAAFCGKLSLVKYLIKMHADLNAKNKYDHTPFHEAVRSGQHEVMGYLLENGADFDVSDALGCHPLHLAVVSGNMKVVTFLIGKGVNVNAKNSYGRTPLFEAAAYNEWNIVKYLIDKGSDAATPDIDEKTIILLFAARKGEWDVVTLLLDKGADVNAKNEFGETPLHTAAKSASLEVVKSLIDKGADFESRYFTVSNSSKKLTLLEFAAYHGNLDTVEYLINKKDVDGNVVEYSSDLLHFAAMSGKLELVKYVVKANTDVNTKDSDGYTALLMAVQSKKINLDLVKYLIKRGAEVNAQDKYGRAPIHGAADSGRLDVVTHLVNKGANINIKDNNGKTVLHNAIIVCYGKEVNFELVKYLVGKDIDLINAPDKVGRTPLHLVIYSGEFHFKASKWSMANQYRTWPRSWVATKDQWDVIKFLIEKGADVNAQDKNGGTLFHRASMNGDLDLVKFIIEKGADFNAIDKDGRVPLHWATNYGNFGIVKYLLEEKKVDVNTKDNIDNTSLYIAASKHQLNVLKYFIDHGADFEIANIFGNTPLHSVARKGHLKVVKLLVERGAKVNALDAHGSTPLHKAASSSDLEVIKYLVENGANHHIQNESGKTPLNLAQERLNRYPECDMYKEITAFLFSLTDAPINQINQLNQQIQSNEKLQKA